MKKLSFIIDNEKCVHCNACITDCPRQIIQKTETVPYVPELLEADCIRCQHCLAVCPTAALSVFGLAPADSIKLGPDSLPSFEKMKNLLRARRSVRQYKTDDIPGNLVNELLAAVANSPTGCNDRGLVFTVIEGRATMKRLLGNIVDTLETAKLSGRQIPEFVMDGVEAYRSDGSDYVFRGAPYLLVVSAKPESHCPNEDVIIALSYFELLAKTAGLGTTWCGYLKFIIEAAPELGELFMLNRGQAFYAMMFGYPSVHYPRTVQRDTEAEIRKVEL